MQLTLLTLNFLTYYDMVEKSGYDFCKKEVFLWDIF